MVSTANNFIPSSSRSKLCTEECHRDESQKKMQKKMQNHGLNKNLSAVDLEQESLFQHPPQVDAQSPPSRRSREQRLASPDVLPTSSGSFPQMSYEQRFVPPDVTRAAARSPQMCYKQRPVPLDHVLRAAARSPRCATSSGSLPRRYTKMQQPGVLRVPAPRRAPPAVGQLLQRHNPQTFTKQFE